MTDQFDPARASIGERLSAARQSRGQSQQDVADQLHLPLSVIEALESERFEQLGAPVYVRGHLRSYLRLMGLPEVLLQGALQQVGEAPPELRTTTHTPRLRYLADRYAMRAVYMLLTLSIIVPALWVATQHAGLGGLQRGDARSLDLPPRAASPEQVDGAVQPAPAETPAVSDRETVVASLAPFYGPSPVVEPRQTDAAGAAEAGWLLRFNEDSWVEVLDRAGHRLEYGLVRANSERRYAAGELARVALGNAGGVTVFRRGESVDLQPFRRANVARFAVSSDGSLESAAD